jgi:hypothetical protein
VEGATQAAQAISKAGCGRQGPEEDCHSSSPRTAGLYLGHWNQSRDYLQAARCCLITTTAKARTSQKKKTESMNADIHLEHRAGSSQGKHEGEPSLGLCDRLSRTRDSSQRQLPTDRDYAVPTREYQTDQSSLKTAPTAARSVFGKRKQRQQQPHCCAELTPSLHLRQMDSLRFARRDASRFEPGLRSTGINELAARRALWVHNPQG